MAISGWTNEGGVDVYSYASGEGLNLSGGGLAPLNHGNNYFVVHTGPAGTQNTLTQTIDLSSAAQSLDSGTVTCTLAGHLGATVQTAGGLVHGTVLRAVFNDANGQPLATTALGPSTPFSDGMILWSSTLLLPGGIRSVVVTLIFGGGDAPGFDFADNLSLVLNTPAPVASILGRNLIVNGDAEAGPAATISALPQDIPGWSEPLGISVGGYTDPQGVKPVAAGLSTPGANFFWGGPLARAISEATQFFDISPAADLVDTGQLTYTLSGWLGGFGSNNDYSYVNLQFGGWINPKLGSAILQGPLFASARQNQTGMIYKTTTGQIPAGTRNIVLQLIFEAQPGPNPPVPFGLADSLSLTLAQGGAPSNAPAISAVTTAGAFGGYREIGVRSWIEIYGTNLAKDTRSWTGADFQGNTAPLGLDGTRVTLGGFLLPVSYISPTQVNAYLPDWFGPGLLDLIVSTAVSSSGPVTLPTTNDQPSLLAPATFHVNGKQYAAALLSDGVTFVAPVGAIPNVTSRPAKPGEVITLYGTGFGAVSPSPAEGDVTTQPNTLTTPLSLSLGGMAATLQYQGLGPGSLGLYQFNAVVPAVMDNDAVPLSCTWGTQQCGQSLFLAVHQ